MSKFNKLNEVMDPIEDLEEDYKDILELSRRCKYKNCTHTTEQHCCIKQAILDGSLSAERYSEYYRLTKEAEYVTKKKNKTKAMDYMKQKRLFRQVK